MGYDNYGEYQYEAGGYAETSPRTFGEMPGLWMQVLSMTTDFFAREAPRASGGPTFINVLIATGVSVVFALISAGLSFVIYGAQSTEYAVGYILGAGCGGFIFSLIGFYLGNGIYYLLARLFGGKGSFGVQTYLASLFIVPLTVVTGILGVLSAIPCINIGSGLMGLGVAIFSLVLYARVISVTHNLDTGKSVAVLIIPLVLTFVIACCLAVGLVVLLGPMIEEIFQEIMWQLDMYYLLG